MVGGHNATFDTNQNFQAISREINHIGYIKLCSTTKLISTKHKLRLLKQTRNSREKAHLMNERVKCESPSKIGTNAIASVDVYHAIHLLHIVSNMANICSILNIRVAIESQINHT